MKSGLMTCGYIEEDDNTVEASKDRVTKTRAGSTGWLELLQQRVKLLDGELGGFQNMRECAPFYGAMGGNSDFQNTFRCPFLQSNVTSSLSNNHKPGTLKRFHNTVVR
jgi:hypothetical protein